jgi:adenosylcobinamide kinase/adenosylcobinamide-phosphate guanylyltransferase
MVQITFITGGARSGKSSFAQKMAESAGENPVYLATARVWDDDFRRRIERHQSDRGPHWTNLEEEKKLSGCHVENRIVLLDCITLWLTNIFFETNSTWTAHSKSHNKNGPALYKKHETDRRQQRTGNGGHPIEESAANLPTCRLDEPTHCPNGRRSFLMVSGIPVKIK